MISILKIDYQKYIQHDCSSSTRFGTIIKLILTQGVWAITVHRLGVELRKISFRPLKLPLLGFWLILKKLVEIIGGIHISGAADLGAGFYIGHFNCFINAKTGNNCSISQGVTIGHSGGGKKGVPTLGDNVYIGAGAKVLGPIKIGHNVKIGANAVVINNIPDNCTAVGIPAHVIKTSHMLNKAA